MMGKLGFLAALSSVLMTGCSDDESLVEQVIWAQNAICQQRYDCRVWEDEYYVFPEDFTMDMCDEYVDESSMAKFEKFASLIEGCGYLETLVIEPARCASKLKCYEFTDDAVVRQKCGVGANMEKQITECARKKLAASGMTEEEIDNWL